MKNKTIPAIVFVVLVIGSILALRLWPRIPDAGQCSATYQRYEGREDIRASFIKDKKINDSVSVDMTLLEAVSDSGWAILQHDFRIPVIPKGYESYFYSDSNQITIRLAPKSDPSLRRDSILLNNDVVTFSYPKHYICVFSINDTSQFKAVLRERLEYNISL